MIKVLSKGMSDAIVNTINGAKTLDFSASPKEMIKMNYEIEREELLTEFKNDSFHSAEEKYEFRKEMKENLKELKLDYKKALIEN